MEHYFTNNQNLKSNFRNIVYNYEDYTFNFTSDLGVFSKDKVDFGSRLLIENYFSHGRKNIKFLDLGCGYGLIGITMAKIMSCDVTMVDVNKRAVHLANMNIKSNGVSANCFESNIYENITEKYDVIMTNPPIRAGKAIVLEFLRNAKDYLNENGELWVVMKKDHGVKSAMKSIEDLYKIEVIDKSKGFYIFIAKTY